MEKLEPIIKQRFWILLGICLLMTIIGWWMATGSMASQITARKADIDGAFGKVPKGSIPNDSWSRDLAARNAEQDRAVRITKLALWEKQKERMTWPATVADFAWQNGYRGEIALTGRENYRTAYGTDVRRVWEVVRPYDPLTGTGMVQFGSQQAEALPQQTWGVLAPSSAEMWDAQEDLWLLESILQSIVNMNGGVNGERLDASIHAIEKLELHGGQPAAQRKSGGGGGNSAAGPGGPGGGHSGPAGKSATAMALGSSGGFGGAGGASAGGSSAIASAEFDWREEFGDDGSGSGGRGGGGGVPGAMSAGPTAAGPTAGHGQAGATGAASGGGSKVKRYIDEDNSLPYKTRGFYLSVIMDHRKVPTLISELTSSETSAWPVEIVRLQVARIYDDDVEGSGAGGSMAGGSMAGGRGANPFGAAARRMTNSGPMGEGFGPGAVGRESSTGPVNNPQADAANAALENALQDPFMARVALCGIITLYKEVKPDPSLAPPAAPSSAPGTTPGSVADVPAPAEAAAGNGDSTEQPAATTAGAAAENPEPTATKTETDTPEAPGADPKAPPADPKTPESKPEPKGAADPAAPPPGNNK